MKKIDLDFSRQELRWISHALWFYKENADLPCGSHKIEVAELLARYDEWLDDQYTDDDLWEEICEELGGIRP